MRTGVKAGLHVIVRGQDVQPPELGPRVNADQTAVAARHVRIRRVRITVGIMGVIGEVAVDVARLQAQLHRIAEPVGQQSRPLPHASVIPIPAGLADEEIGIERRPPAIVAHRADDRQEVERRSGLVLLVEAEQRHIGARIRAPGDRRGDHDPVVGNVIDIGARITHPCDDAPRQLVAGRKVEVGQHLLAIEAAIGQLHLARVREHRRLRHEIDEPADRSLSEQNRGGTAHHLDPREIVRVRRDVDVIAVDVAHAVTKLQRTDAADRERVDARVAAIQVGQHARRIAHRIGNADRALRQIGLARDDRDRLRHLDRWRVGFGRRLRFGHAALDEDIPARLAICNLALGVGGIVGGGGARCQRDQRSSGEQCES
jgi:hypothetical protein